jgi:hypothetical protein
VPWEILRHAAPCRNVPVTCTLSARFHLPPPTASGRILPPHPTPSQDPAPASNHRLTSARSASVIPVALFMGMSFCTTTCW